MIDSVGLCAALAMLAVGFALLLVTSLLDLRAVAEVYPGRSEARAEAA